MSGTYWLIERQTSTGPMWICGSRTSSGHWLSTKPSEAIRFESQSEALVMLNLLPYMPQHPYSVTEHADG